MKQLKFLCAIILAISLSPVIVNAQQDTTSPFTEEAQLTTSLDRAITDVYETKLQELLASKRTMAEKFQQMQSYLDLTALCSLQRHHLYKTSDTDKTRYLGDASKLQFHYGYFAFALQRQSVIDAKQANKSYWEQKPAGEAKIKAIFLRNATSGKKQATEEIYQLANNCNRTLEIVKSTEALAMKQIK